MVDQELAYTPHPALKARVSVLAASPRGGKQSSERGIAAFAVTAVAAASVMMAMQGAPRENSAQAAEPAHTFAARPAAAEASSYRPAPVETSVGVENRATSPAPFLSDASGSAADVAAPAAAYLNPTAPALASTPQFRSLTSFDEKTELTSGQASAQQQSVRPFAPAPVVWNHPVQWIAVHQAGL